MKVIKHKDRWYLQSDTGYKEILLSTDTELQKDGIQAIDDTFLEWLVKNPSCESVEVETTRERNGYHSKHKKRYKIIIPKEPKQETLEEAAVDYISEKSERAREYGMVFNAIRFGAKWQAERMYSEEDLREAFRQGQDNMDYSDTYGWDSKLTEQEWFEQFKKK